MGGESFGGNVEASAWQARINSAETGNPPSIWKTNWLC